MSAHSKVVDFNHRKPLQNATSPQSQSNPNLFGGSLLLPHSPVIHRFAHEAGSYIALSQTSRSALGSSTDESDDFPSNVAAQYVSEDPTPNTPLSTIAKDSDNKQRSPNSHASDDLLIDIVPSSGEAPFCPLEYVSKGYDLFVDITTLSYVPPFDLRRLVKRIATMEAITIPRLRELNLVGECLCACDRYCESFELSYYITKHLEASYASMLSWRIKAAIGCARSCVTTEQCEYTIQLLERLIIWFENTAINDAAVIVLSLYLVDLYESRKPGSSQDYLNRVTKYVKGDHANLPDLEPSCRFREHFALKYKLENHTLPIEIPFSVPGSKYLDSMLGDIETANITVLGLLNWCHSVLLEHEKSFEHIIGSGELTPRQCVIVLFRDFVELWLGSGPRSSKPSPFLREQADRARYMLSKTLLSEIDALAALAWLIINEVSLQLGFYSDTNTFLKQPKRSSILQQTIIELINYGPAISHKFRDAYLSRISSSLAERRHQCIASEENLSDFNYLDLRQHTSHAIIGEFLKLASLSSYTSSRLELHTGAHPSLNIHITEPHVVKNLSHIPEHSPMPDPSQECIEIQSTLSRTPRRSSLSSGFRSLALRLRVNSATALSISSKQTVRSSNGLSVMSLESRESWQFSHATGMHSNTSFKDSDSTRERILDDTMDTS